MAGEFVGGSDILISMHRVSLPNHPSEILVAWSSGEIMLGFWQAVTAHMNLTNSLEPKIWLCNLKHNVVRCQSDTMTFHLTNHTSKLKSVKLDFKVEAQIHSSQILALRSELNFRFKPCRIILRHLLLLRSWSQMSEQYSYLVCFCYLAQYW